MEIRQSLIKLIILVVMLIGLPLIGIILAGYPLHHYLELPPRTRYVQHAAFSGMVFTAILAFTMAVVLPPLWQSLRSLKQYGFQWSGLHPFPWWGWLGVIGCPIMWLLAWTRFAWFTTLQPHTFFPLWLSFIIILNAICYCRTGKCMLLDRTFFFMLLFPLSAVFWWFFEYLNRFVQNWYYLGGQYSPLQYFLLATLSFSTVLPAVLSMQKIIISLAWVQKGFTGILPLKCSNPNRLAGFTLLCSGLGLFGIGIWPDYLFPLLWISPLLIIVSLQVLLHETHVFAGIPEGNWSYVVSFALAALCCGFFWEMWNLHSLAKWEYSIPFVHRIQIFEMPVLGFAGYLPFGLECAVIGNMLEKLIGNNFDMPHNNTYN
jgi:hypothetical protein